MAILSYHKLTEELTLKINSQDYEYNGAFEMYEDEADHIKAPKGVRIA